MRILVVSCLLLLTACGQNSSGEKSGEKDTVKSKTDTSFTPPIVAPGTVPGSQEVNDLLKQKGEGKWHVITDKESGWTPDVFDYFVVSERKKNPDYPYIARGDFDCDKKNDIASLVTDSIGKETRLVFFLGDDKKISWWDEDAKGAALMTIPPGEVSGFEGDIDKEKKVKLSCNGVEAVWYEQSSYVVYWDGRKFVNLWTGD